MQFVKLIVIINIVPNHLTTYFTLDCQNLEVLNSNQDIIIIIIISLAKKKKKGLILEL